MNKPLAITAFVDARTLESVAAAAAAAGVTVEDFAAQAIAVAAEEAALDKAFPRMDAAEFEAFIQEGIDSADRGELIAHEVAMAELDAMIAKHKARCR